MMTLKVIVTVIALFYTVSATETVTSKRAYGLCKQLDIPITATADSAIYNYPTVDNDLEAGAWALNADTWSNLAGIHRIIKNTTISGTWNIHAQLCIPATGPKKDILQIATHGISYDSRYWDSELNRQNQSYVEATLEAGYSILTYDRLGVGQSDHPDAYTVVQAPLELEILRQITLMARNGSLYSFASKAKPVDSTFNQLAKPSKIVHVGHSFGSFLSSAFIAKHSDLTDGAILTGYILNQYLGKPGTVSFVTEYAATSNPPFNRTSGYVVSTKQGIQSIFFGGDLKSAYTPEMFKYGDSIKQPIAVGEIESAFWIVGLPGPNLKAPVQYMLAEFDFYVCSGNCVGAYNLDAVKATYPNATAVEVAIQPNTGHGLTLHNNATAGYQVSHDFLAKHGL